MPDAILGLEWALNATYDLFQSLATFFCRNVVSAYSRVRFFSVIKITTTEENVSTHFLL
jgi:hypothetical protein